MKKTFKKSKQSGFTLIEILIVIGIIAILAAIVLVAVNPAKQFKAADDAQRVSNLNAILNAIGQYTVDNRGLKDIDDEISTTGANISSSEADLCDLLVPEYIAALPADPDASDQSIDCSETSYDTLYEITQDGDRVTITSPNADPDIIVTR